MWRKRLSSGLEDEEERIWQVLSEISTPTMLVRGKVPFEI